MDISALRSPSDDWDHRVRGDRLNLLPEPVRPVSIADGIVRIDDIVKAAAADGQGALALTDLGNAFGLVRFYQEARGKGIKPIAGCDVWIANPDGKHLFALSQKCPHLGCRVPFCESSGRFECPCHGSVFDIAGEYIKGPTPRGMDRFGLTLKNDALIVDTGVVDTGPNRGVHQYLTPPKGPSCAKES